MATVKAGKQLLTIGMKCNTHCRTIGPVTNVCYRLTQTSRPYLPQQNTHRLSSSPEHLLDVKLSLLSLWNRQIKYQPVWLGIRWGMYTYVGWQVTMGDLIWQVMLRRSKMSFL